MIHPLLSLSLSLLIQLPASGALPPAASGEPLLSPSRKAVQIMADIDGNGQMFTLSIAAIGGIGAIGAGGWILHERPLPTNHSPSPLLFSNALLIASTGVGQFIHGLMRLGERRASAASANLLLNGPTTTQKEELAFLRHRAHQSQSTRFVGAVITTLQGLASTAAGLQLALQKDSDYTKPGWVLAGLGIATTAIGSVHFFGKTRAQRELAAALGNEGLVTSPTLELTPILLAKNSGHHFPGLGLSGTF